MNTPDFMPVSVLVCLSIEKNPYIDTKNIEIQCWISGLQTPQFSQKSHTCTGKSNRYTRHVLWFWLEFGSLHWVPQDVSTSFANSSEGYRERMWRARFCFVLRGAIRGPNLIIFYWWFSMPQRRTFFQWPGMFTSNFGMWFVSMVNGGFPIKLSWDEHLWSIFVVLVRWIEWGIFWMDARIANRIIPHQQRSSLWCHGTWLCAHHCLRRLSATIG